MQPTSVRFAAILVRTSTTRMSAYKNPQGEAAEKAVKAFFESSGCTVIPYGMEHTLKEVADLSAAAFRKLNLDKVVTSAPDFFVLTSKNSGYRLLEVKYRKSWDDYVRTKLKESLEPQARYWPGVKVLIALRSPTGAAGLPESHVRVAELFYEADSLSVHVHSREATKEWDAVEWQNLTPIQELFPGFCTGEAGRIRLGQLVETIRKIPDESLDKASLKKLWNEDRAKKLAKKSSGVRDSAT